MDDGVQLVDAALPRINEHTAITHSESVRFFAAQLPTDDGYVFAARHQAAFL
jgi:hypothetical protein